MAISSMQVQRRTSPIEYLRRDDTGARHRWASGAAIYGDGLTSIGQNAHTGHLPSVLITVGGLAVTAARGARQADGALGNVKRSIGGRYHAAGPGKYARVHPAAAWHRCNRGVELTPMALRPRRTMMLYKPCPGPVLHAAGNFHG